MGVRGLYTHILDYETFKIIDLVQEAQNSKGIEILVDFNAFIRELTELLSKILVNEYENMYLHYPGGEFDILFDAFYNFHKAFDEAKIKLVWIINGPKGIDKEASDHKEKTWNDRMYNNMDKLDNLLNCCISKSPPTDLHNLIPTNSFEVSIAALKKAGAEVIQLLQGETDEYTAYIFHKRKSYAIITNDTNYLIFPGCQVIFSRLMKFCYRNDDLKLPFIDTEDVEKIFKKPDSFRCPVVSQDLILQSLKFESHEQLVVLSILKGNEYNIEFIQELQVELELIQRHEQTPRINAVANYIKNKAIDFHNILEQPGIIRLEKKLPKLFPSINFCKNFYSLKRIEENIEQSMVIYKPSVTENSLTDYLARKFSNSELWLGLYSIHLGSVSDSVIPEKPNSECRDIFTILGEIRAKVYPYVLKEDLTEVIESPCRGGSRFVTVPVTHANLKTNQIQGQPDGIKIFSKIWSHLEQDGQLRYFETFGLEIGFICYLLRYFYQITKQKNLKVSSDEFRALFITVFYCFSISRNLIYEFNTRLRRQSFLGMKICPTERCLIIDVWFLQIFRSAKYITGGTLNLTEFFPDIQHVMSGSVFYTFYESVMNEKNDRLSHLDNMLQDSIVTLGKNILRMHNDKYIEIIK